MVILSIIIVIIFKLKKIMILDDDDDFQDVSTRQKPSSSSRKPEISVTNKRSTRGPKKACGQRNDGTLMSCLCKIVNIHMIYDIR